MCCRKCGCNQVGGTQTYPCKAQLDKVKKELLALEECLAGIVTPPTPPRPPRPPRPCHCHCCCCCCCYARGNTNGNQTSWGR